MWMGDGRFLYIFLLGLLTIPSRCDGRAVNISNTWTLPHDGFTVFYRFFRDQISWFEADAVCQFHHANLVTVDNSLTFDAARDFLRVLDVNEPVWIGLMRPQNSERFSWSNSKPLTSEYWAESLPLIDAPLCAVIDPIRDYRWHALRCGGPETASFLCEMNVPNWAEDCVFKDIPSLTIQYMADSGTVEITKDCGIDEGAIHQVCRGKQDQERIIKNLICKNEQQKQQQQQQQVVTQNSMMSNINHMRIKTLSIINKISSDNNEDNNINAQSISKSANNNNNNTNYNDHNDEVTVQKLIDQFNVEELMQADQPVGNRKPDSGNTTTKPKKNKQNKKLKSKGEKKMRNGKKQQEKQKDKNVDLSDMMMGDQPAVSSQSADDDDFNEIQAQLPHTKKSLVIDMKSTSDNLSKFNKPMHSIVHQEPTETSTTILSIPTISPATTTTTTISASNIITNPTDEIVTIFEENDKDEIELSTSTITPEINHLTTSTTLINLNTHVDVEQHQINTETIPAITTTTSLPSQQPGTATDIISTDKPSATIGHPMHPQQSRSNIITEESGHQHVKETNDNHFIPPMLMVKSHYTSPKGGHNEPSENKSSLEHEENVKFTTFISNVETSTSLSSPDLPAESATLGHQLVDDSNAENHFTNERDIIATETTINSTTTTAKNSSPIQLENVDDTTTKEKLVITTTNQPAAVQTTNALAHDDDLLIETTSNNHQTVEIKIENIDNPTTFVMTTRSSVPITTNKPQMEEIKSTLPLLTTVQIGQNEKIESGTTDYLTITTQTTPQQLATSEIKQLQKTTATITDDNSSTSSSSSSSFLANKFASNKNIPQATETQKDKTETAATTFKMEETTTAKTISTTTTNIEHHTTKIKTSNFPSNEDDDDLEPYKPNRRRSLTKPENPSYLKKILG